MTTTYYESEQDERRRETSQAVLETLSAACFSAMAVLGAVSFLYVKLAPFFTYVMEVLR